MGVLTDFVVATDEQSHAGLEVDQVSQDDRVDLKGIDHVKITKLDCLLTGREWDVEIINREYPIVHEASEDGPWVSRVSDALVKRLVELDEKSVSELSERWWQIEEFQPAKWSDG